MKADRFSIKWVARVALAVLVCALLESTGCKSTGAKIDDLCIAGQVREVSAIWLNDNPWAWKQHGDYSQPIKSGDRLLNADCSEALKAAGEKKPKGVWASAKRVFGFGSPDPAEASD